MSGDSIRFAHMVRRLPTVLAALLVGCGANARPSTVASTPPPSESTQTLTPGTDAIGVSLSAQDGGTFDLAPLLGQGPVVLVFYRGFW